MVSTWLSNCMAINSWVACVEFQTISFVKMHLARLIYVYIYPVCVSQPKPQIDSHEFLWDKKYGNDKFRKKWIADACVNAQLLQVQMSKHTKYWLLYWCANAKHIHVHTSQKATKEISNNVFMDHRSYDPSLHLTQMLQNQEVWKLVTFCCNVNLLPSSSKRRIHIYSGLKTSPHWDACIDDGLK